VKSRRLASFSGEESSCRSSSKLQISILNESILMVAMFVCLCLSGFDCIVLERLHSVGRVNMLK